MGLFNLWGHVQILLTLKALYALKDIFVKLLPTVNPACSAAIIWFGLAPVQDDFHYDFTRMAGETGGSVVLAEL